jgi:hypothetical protein
MKRKVAWEIVPSNHSFASEETIPVNYKGDQTIVISLMSLDYIELP